MKIKVHRNLSRLALEKFSDADRDILRGEIEGKTVDVSAAAAEMLIALKLSDAPPKKAISAE